MNVILAQARMTSTRLPGKCMMKLAGAPMIDWIIDAMDRAMCKIQTIDFYGVIVPKQKKRS